MTKRPPVPPPSEKRPVNRLHTPVTVSFLYYEVGGKFCLSACQKDEIESALDALHRLAQISWQDVQRSGGGHKTGFRYTIYDDNALTGVRRPSNLSNDMNIIGLASSQKGRFFGVYIDHVFYLLWFDPNHKIVPV